MSSAKITTVGFYQYMNAYNNDLFGLLNLPPGIDKDTLINNILLRGGEFEVVYSNPDFYKSAIGLWSNKHYRTFEKWINALNIDYNPLENYDRMEEWTDAGTRTNTGTVSDAGKRTNTGTVSDSGMRTNTGTVSDSGTHTNTGTQSTNTTGKVQAIVLVLMKLVHIIVVRFKTIKRTQPIHLIQVKLIQQLIVLEQIT